METTESFVPDHYETNPIHIGVMNKTDQELKIRVYPFRKMVLDEMGDNTPEYYKNYITITDANGVDVSSNRDELVGVNNGMYRMRVHHANVIQNPLSELFEDSIDIKMILCHSSYKDLCKWYLNPIKINDGDNSLVEITPLEAISLFQQQFGIVEYILEEPTKNVGLKDLSIDFILPPNDAHGYTIYTSAHRSAAFFNRPDNFPITPKLGTVIGIESKMNADSKYDEYTISMKLDDDTQELIVTRTHTNDIVFSKTFSNKNKLYIKRIYHKTVDGRIAKFLDKYKSAIEAEDFKFVSENFRMETTSAIKSIFSQRTYGESPYLQPLHMGLYLSPYQNIVNIIDTPSNKYMEVPDMSTNTFFHIQIPENTTLGIVIGEKAEDNVKVEFGTGFKFEAPVVNLNEA